MTLMQRGANNMDGNAPYAEKLMDYRVSPYQITRRLPDDYPEWTPATLDERQQALARMATGTWRIGQLD
jgi:Protein of unknown function (DUF1524)